LKPWLFWSVVYGLCRLTKGLATADVGTLWEMVSIETLLAGTSIHLWYLPYAFLSGMLVYVLNRWTSHIGDAIVLLAATIVGMVLLAVHATGTWDHLASPLPQWEFGLSAIPLGIAVGRCLTIPSRERRRLLLLLIALIVAIECQMLQWLGLGSPVIPHGIGLALVCLAYWWETRGNIVVASLASLTFGVYLIHPLVIHVLRRTSATNDHYVLFILLTVCISALATLILMRTPLRRFV
jgi:surface polysaccharide O-acyltransferase-like enzyme